MAVFYESYYGVSSLGSNDYLMHHGVKGMKWGVRRYQNPDWSLTDAGRRRYDAGKPLKEQAKKAAKSIRKGAEAAAGKAKSIYRTVDRAMAKHAAKRGDAEGFMKHAKSMTDDEIKSALNRISTIQTIDNLRAQRQKNNFDRFNRAVSSVKTSIEIGVAAGKGLKKFSKWIGRSDKDKVDEKIKEIRDKKADNVYSDVWKREMKAGKSPKKAMKEAEKAVRDLYDYNNLGGSKAAERHKKLAEHATAVAKDMGSAGARWITDAADEFIDAHKKKKHGVPISF